MNNENAEQTQDAENQDLVALADTILGDTPETQEEPTPEPEPEPEKKEEPEEEPEKPETDEKEPEPEEEKEKPPKPMVSPSLLQAAAARKAREQQQRAAAPPKQEATPEPAPTPAPTSEQEQQLTLESLRETFQNDPDKLYEMLGVEEGSFQEIARALYYRDNPDKAPEGYKPKIKLASSGTSKEVAEANRKIAELQQLVEARETERQISAYKNDVAAYLRQIPEDHAYLRRLIQHNEASAVEHLYETAQNIAYEAQQNGVQADITPATVARLYEESLAEQLAPFIEQQKADADEKTKEPSSEQKTIATNAATPVKRPKKPDSEMSEGEFIADLLASVRTGKR